MGIKGFFTKKRVIWTIIVVLVVAGIANQFFKSKNNSAGIQTDVIKKQNLQLTVLSTGQVVSSTDLDLSFKTSGVVQKVNVKEGDKVKAGTVLAMLDQKDASASLTSAQGSLAQAQANYQKVLAGSSSQQVGVAQKAVEAAQVSLNTATTGLQNTKAQQATAVSNAYSSLLNSTLTASPSQGNSGSAVVTVSGTYVGTDQGVYNISIYSTGSGLMFKSSGLENSSGNVKSTPVPLGSNGLYIQFAGLPGTNDIWMISIPNTLVSSYVVNYNAYQSALKNQQTALDTAQAQVDSAKAALAQAQANLDLQTAAARPADVAAAQAQILSAQGQVQAAQAALSNAIITAPADGTITSVDIKVGELSTAMKEAIVLQDVGSLHVEADVSEANIANLQSGQSVDVTFDALGPDKHFQGSVQTINPGAKVVSGVVDYLVKASLPNIPEIKPGMTANMTIMVAQKNNVLAVTQQAVINQNGGQYVRVIDDTKKKTYHQVQVQTGLLADGGLVEITSGLSEGQEVVTFIK